ncbi:MAG: toll/interleukin-1 receptor domain-containing protein [Pseudomonadota bacterium]
MARKRKIFVSYASARRDEAEPVALSLLSRGYDVFFDKDDLPAGQTYHDQISSAIKASDLMVFMVSPESVTGGRYTVSELKFARQKWPTPKGRVLPVMLTPTPIDDIPAYLREVSILEGEGSLVAEAGAQVSYMIDAIEQSESATRRKGLMRWAAAAAAAALVVIGSLAAWQVLGSDGDPSLSGRAVVQSPRLGLQIQQNGTNAPMNTEENGSGTEAFSSVLIDRAPFEIKVPSLHWKTDGDEHPAVRLAVFDSAAIFDAVALNQDRRETSYFGDGMGFADYEFGSGQLWTVDDSNPSFLAGHNYFSGTRFADIGERYRTIFVSSVIDQATESDLMDTADALYFVIYIDQDPAQADWQAPDPMTPGEVERLTVRFR